MRKRHYGYAVLLIITLIWGTTFTVTKWALAAVPPLYYLAWRFSLAALGLLLLSSRQLPTITRVELTGGTVIGFFLAWATLPRRRGWCTPQPPRPGLLRGWRW